MNEKLKSGIKALLEGKIDTITAVDLSGGIKAMQVRLHPELYVSGLSFCPSGSGGAKDPADGLKSCLQGESFSRNAVLVPHLSHLTIKRVQMPGMQPAEALDALKWQHSADEAGTDQKVVIDYSLIHELIQEDGSAAMDVVYAACPEEEVRQQVLQLKQAGLECVAVVPAAFGYAAYLDNFVPSAKGVLSAVLHIDDERSFLCVCNAGRLEFYRELPVSLARFREALASVLVSDKGKIELTPQEAEEGIFKIGIPKDDAQYKDKLNAGQILAMIRSGLERLTAEVNRSFAYYESQFSGGKVARIFTAGKASAVPNLDTFLSRELNLKVEVIPLPPGLVPPAGMDIEQLRRSCSCLGIGAGFNRLVNLLPHEFKVEKFERLQKLSLRWVSLTVFAVLLLSFIFVRAATAIYQNRLMLATQQLSILSEISRLKSRTEELEAFNASRRDKEPRVTEILKQISRFSPPELLLESLSLDSATAEMVLSGVISGGSKNPDELLSKFVGEMKGSPYIKEAEIDLVEKVDEAEGHKNRVKFNIKFTLQ